MNMPTVRRPRYADIASTLALVIAMGGTAYATATVGTSDIKNGAVTRTKVHDGAIVSAKLRTGAVTRAKVAADAVAGPKVANESLTLADLRGINLTGNIAFTLAANACGTLNLAVTGAVPGQAALLTYTGSTPPPTNVVFGPLKVESSSLISARACNIDGSSISVTGLGVRIVTFG